MANERKNTTPGIEELSGQTDTRTRQERQRDALEDWLNKPNWSPDEARFLLVGLDPEQSFSERKGHWWLPLASTADKQRDLECQVDDGELQDRLRRVDGLGLKTAPPHEIIRTAYKAKIFIPWLQVAVHDKNCKLPPTVRRAEIRREQAEATKRANLDGRNKGTRARHAANRASKVESAQLVINDLNAAGYPRIGERVNKSEVVRKILDRHPDWEIENKTIRNWINSGILIL